MNDDIIIGGFIKRLFRISVQLIIIIKIKIKIASTNKNKFLSAAPIATSKNYV